MDSSSTMLHVSINAIVPLDIKEIFLSHWTYWSNCAPYFFAGIYLITLSVVFGIFKQCQSIPPYTLIFLALSKQLHSISVLRLFDDGIKMSVFYCDMVQSCFVHRNESVEFDPVFFCQWTVNWHMLLESNFLSQGFAYTMLTATHVSLLGLFAWTRWCRAYASRRVTPDYTVKLCFTSNLIGMVCARTLHYQFYSWYAHQIVYLLWQTSYPLWISLLEHLSRNSFIIIFTKSKIK
ncbi:uncharacterized protein MELLADRAFT_91322 [Melampsora larici-populina 98AG31]|uniref:Dol-P-Man:Man(5)GlcNAc(2)-PP-Dol alpha-1,3-mannosyltransferase n=1 Tax=Melampsora larici-populina (strain 98AG31 / pathotype 3-4-7) TaxID=747676 RepID=F4RYM5_MELLP|nr:uncharacterized protein MELLADRAFT_91322 [Melampsora larici-populina 98AG31]EGG02550.1 hypothetical protein MELLADRAFT_91322 [Melampsora larici-populina 98AG31]